MKLESHWLDTAPALTGASKEPVAGRAEGHCGPPCLLPLAGAFYLVEDGVQ